MALAVDASGRRRQNSKHTMAAQTILSDFLNISSLNCEGVSRSTDFISDFPSISSCDLMCLQETWLLDQNICKLGDINDQYYILENQPLILLKIYYMVGLSEVLLFFITNLLQNMLHV